MFFRLLVTVVALGLSSSAALAQLDLPPAPTPTPTPKVESPTPEPSESAASPAQEPAFFAEPSNKIEELFNSFEREPSISKDIYSTYLDDLRGFGLSSRNTALKALFSPHSRSIELAAEILEWVGSPTDTNQLVTAASVASDISAVSRCLDSATRLQGHLPALAASLLDHPRRQVRVLIESRLSESLNEDYLPKLLQFVAYGRDSDLRLRATRLVSLFNNNADARQALRKALNDESVSVAMQAVTALVGKGNSVELSAMRQEFIESEHDVEAAYILFGLLEIQSERGESVFNAELEPRMRELSQRQDVFISAVASACLAEQLFRSELVGSIVDIEQQLIFNLVRAVGGVDFYPQYARFAPLAQMSLRRVTGESMLDQPANAWVAWYESKREGLQLMRGRIDVSPLDLPRLRFAVTAADGQQRVLCGTAAYNNFGDRILGNAGQAKLFSLLNEHSLLKASMRPGDLGLITAPLSAELSISIGEQRKVLRFRGSAGSDWLPSLLREFDAIYSATGWQSLASTGEGGLAFILQHLDDFDGALLDGKAKGELFLKLSAGRLGGLSIEALSLWMAELKLLEDRQQFWTPALSSELFMLAESNSSNPTLANTCIELALTVSYPELFARAIDVAMRQQAAQRGTSCALVLNNCPLEQRQIAMTDDREVVRLAAVHSLVSAGSGSIPALVVALDDASMSVVHYAMTALGDMAAVAALPQLSSFVGAEYDDNTRTIAIEAIAAIGDPSSLRLLKEAAQDFSVAIKIAAVNAIAKIDGDDATAVLVELFPSFADSNLDSSFQRALFLRGAAACRNIIRPYLLDSDPVRAEHAAINSGLAGEPAAAPALMSLLKAQPRSDEILAALVSATGADFRRTPDPAGTYAAWWDANSNELPRDWLRSSLIESGYDLDEHFDDATRCSPKLAVEQLLSALVNGPARLRPLCAYFLFNITEVDAQIILGGTPQSELVRRAQPWRDWLNAAD